MSSGRLVNLILLVTAAAGLATGGLAWFLRAPEKASIAWAAAIVPVLAAEVVAIAGDLRRGKTGVDVVAVLAMGGALALGEYLAGAVIALMLTGGRSLENFASARARRELAALLARTPRRAHRYADHGIEEVDIEQVAPGDRLLVKGGEVVPVDGLVEGRSAVLDESALTGEALPVTRSPGEQASSGTLNAGAPFDLRAITSATGSTYAGVVRLVESAQAAKAPFVRLADRYALVLIPVTLVLAGLAWWASGDPVRALAVLVVATPCPLILAAPVAIVAGISRAARRGILMKSGGALETLARARVLLFDKTGTLTTGAARLLAVETGGGADPNEILRLAASLEQVSQHVLAAAITRTARQRGLHLSLPQAVREEPGAGMCGTVDGREVLLGTFDWVTAHVPALEWTGAVLRRMEYEGASAVFVSIDGGLAGALLLADEIRPETPKALRVLHREGIARIIMVSGDRQEVAETIAAALGVDEVLAERSPADKVEAVAAERAEAVTLMVGDGINDAPALAAADVGIAMGARGAAASSEAADVVLLVDRLDRVTEALRIARRSRAIAVQSVVAGMGLAFAAMLAAAAGWLVPVVGALVQEAIDVAVILNALRAVGAGRQAAEPTIPRATAEQLAAEHRELLPVLDRIRSLADRLDELPPAEASREVRALDTLLREHLLPHERSDDAELYPALAAIMGGSDPLGAMSRTHREIDHLGRLYARLAAELPGSGPGAGELRDIRRVLYALEAILRLHFSQEEEIYGTMADDGPAPRAAPPLR